MDERLQRLTAICDAKRAYANEAHAVQAAKKLERRYRAAHKPYKCSVCPMWHLSTKRKIYPFNFEPNVAAWNNEERHAVHGLFLKSIERKQHVVLVFVNGAYQLRKYKWFKSITSIGLVGDESD